MDRRSWLWRRKSSEKSPGETESSGSVSSHSERFSEEQEVLRVSSVTASPNHAQSPEVSSKITSYDPNETIKSLHEKLSAALSSISAKEEMVQQHAKVAEEAVSGWEKAEADVSALKRQLEVTLQKNSVLEDRTNHLDGALKECVRQLRQSRNEQEQEVKDALMKKTTEWENEKFELETQIIELQAKLEVKAETVASTDQLQLQLEALEKEKYSLQIELLARMDDLHLRTLERDLSTQAAETASKQHLESIKKVAKLEAECRRLHRKSSPLYNHIQPSFRDQKPVPSSVCAESLTDSQSDSGERLVNLDNELSCSDSWASALIAELDHFKNDKAITGNLTAASMEIDLMDDFLEMEKLAALPETGHASSSFDVNSNFNNFCARDGPSSAELEVRRVMAELEQKVAKLENEKVKMEMALAEAHNQLEISCDKLIIAENKLIELQQQLSAANGSKIIFDEQMEVADVKRKQLESELESTPMTISKLNEKISLLEGRAEEEKALFEKLESIMEDKESMEAERMALAFQLESAQLESRKLHEMVNLLGREVDEERKLSSEYLARCQNMEIVTTKCKEVETQLISANKKVSELHSKVSTLEGKLKEEEALSLKLSANMEEVEANRKNLSTQLESTNVNSVKLKKRVRTLEEELLDRSALSAELEAKCQQFQSQLGSAHFEIEQLYKKVTLLERIIDEERASSAEYKAQAGVLESQISSAQLEVEELHKKASLLEKERSKSAELAAKCRNLEDETVISARLAANLERTLLASKEELAAQLESAHLEVKRLHDKVSSLHEEADKERTKSAELAAKCRNLEDEPSRKKQDDDVQGSVTSNGVLKLKQDKDFVMAAETFAACQKTIDSLSQQLKSLSNFENLMVEPEKADCDIESLDLTGMSVKILRNSSEIFDGSSAALLNGKESGSLLSSNEY